MKARPATFPLVTVFLVLLLAYSHDIRADVVVLNPTADTGIQSNRPDNNMGAHTLLVTGGNRLGQPRRGLFLFDLSSILPGSSITAITLTIEALATPNGTVNSTFAIHRVIAPWSEGSGTGNSGTLAIPGESSWNSAGPAAWTTPGGDFAAGASATTAVAGPGTYNWLNGGLISDVQTWVDSPSANNGWLLMSQSESTGNTGRRWGTRESASPASLMITFTPVPEPGSGLLCSGALLLLFARRRLKS